MRSVGRQATGKGKINAPSSNGVLAWSVQLKVLCNFFTILGLILCYPYCPLRFSNPREAIRYPQSADPPVLSNSTSNPGESHE